MRKYKEGTILNGNLSAHTLSVCDKKTWEKLPCDLIISDITPLNQFHLVFYLDI